MYVYYDIVQCQNVQSNCQMSGKKAERSVVLIVFNDVLYHVRAYTVTFIFVALHESGSRKAIMWSVII